MEASTQEKEKVLVLGGSTRAFLTVVRSLGRKSLEVHVANPSFDKAALRSRYIAKVHYLPPQSEPDIWKEGMASILAKERFTLVIPTNDPAIILCRRFRSELERYSPIYLLNDEADRAVNDKMRTYELATSLGVNVPRSMMVQDRVDPSLIAKEFALPLMLKPISSFHSQELSSKRFVKKVRSENELPRMLEEMLASGPLMVQEYFEGVGVGVEVLALHGRILTKFQHIRVHEPRGGGPSTYRKSMAVDPELLQAAVKIMGAVDYTGVGMLEFRVDQKTGRWTLIEINGRFWGSLPLPVGSGMDFPYYLYDMLVHGRTEFPQEYRTNIYCRNTTMDIKWMRENAAAEWREVLGEVRNIVGLRERNDSFVLDDPRPGITEVAEIVLPPLTSPVHMISSRVRDLPMMRRRRARQLRKELSTARSVMFVCMGNICRSPFAEHYARKVMPQTTAVSSSGTYQVEGRSTPQDGITASSALGLDLRPHRSHMVTEDMMRAADVVFVFDEKNMRTMRERFPHYRRRLWYISEIDPSAPRNTQDPFGKDLHAYQEAYRKISGYVDAMRDRPS